MTRSAIQLKRAYDKPARSDGLRILVERLWPRGLTKAKARIDLWLKDIAPSPQLRKWYNHDVAKWTELQKRYRSELRKNVEAVKSLRSLARKGPVTLIYAARDELHNSALVLKQVLERSRQPRTSRRPARGRKVERAHP